MLDRQLSRKFVITAGLVVAMGALGASQSWADKAHSRTSSHSRGGSAFSGSSHSRGVSGRTAVHRGGRSHSRGAASTRSGGGVRHSGSRGSRGDHGYRGHRGGRHSSYYGLSLGYYGRYGAFFGGYGGYGGYYYNPFYYGYPLYYSYHPRRYSDFGALDLNVRPKKTEVWVDGEYVGAAGRFDGYPGHLWLGDGRHELIFYSQGFETVRREVNVLEGVVLDIHHDMVPGASVPAQELMAFGQEELRQREVERVYQEPRDRRDRFDERRRSNRRSIREDAREEPGRLKLEIAPVDASIYLDGRFLGSGQELERLHSGLMVSPGEHTLEVVRPGFDSEEVPFSVESGEETTLRIELEEARV